MAGLCIKECSFELESQRTFVKFVCVFSGENRLWIYKQKKKVVIALANLDVISLEFILETVQRKSWRSM